MDESARWICENYQHLLTPQEKAAYKSLLVGRKMAGSPPTQQRMMRERWVSSDPEVLALLDGGEENFMNSVRDRVVRERGDELNRCPKCGAAARTPSAKQCPKCYYSWHEK